jgi:hypothetical protein
VVPKTCEEGTLRIPFTCNLVFKLEKSDIAIPAFAEMPIFKSLQQPGAALVAVASCALMATPTMKSRAKTAIIFFIN